MKTLPDNVTSDNLFAYLGACFGCQPPKFPADYIPTVFLLYEWQVPKEPDNLEYWDLAAEQFWAAEFQADNLPEKYL